MPSLSLADTLTHPVFSLVKLSLAHHNEWKVGDSCEARYSADSLWYPAKIDEMVKAGDKLRYVVTYNSFGNSEELAYEDIRDPQTTVSSASAAVPSTSVITAASTTTPVSSKTVPNGKSPASPGQKFEVGDICEGKFTVDETWYMCEIQQVLLGGRKYVVLYTDYGNSETLTPDRLRVPTFE